MHDGDKIGCADIGRLTRSRNRIIVNPFPECNVELIGKFNKVRTNFSKSSKNTIHFNDAKKHADEVPDKSMKVDINATRIAAVRVLINYYLRMKNVL